MWNLILYIRKIHVCINCLSMGRLRNYLYKLTKTLPKGSLTLGLATLFTMFDEGMNFSVDKESGQLVKSYLYSRTYRRLTFPRSITPYFISHNTGTPPRIKHCRHKSLYSRNKEKRSESPITKYW